MKKVRIILPIMLALCVALTLAACGNDTITGDGGVAPENYYKVEKAGSSFYLPEHVTKSGSSNGVDGYAFSGGNVNVVTTDITTKASKISKLQLKASLQASIVSSNLNWDFSIDAFQFYKLSGLVILADELTITDKDSGKTLKEYQYTYDTASKQVCITVTFNSVQDGEESDFPQKLLYSIALSE